MAAAVPLQNWPSGRNNVALRARSSETAVRYLSQGDFSMTTSLSLQILHPFARCPFLAKRFLTLRHSTLVFFALFVAASAPLAATFAVKPPARLKCESMSEPLGIDVTSPRLSWQLQ